MMTRHQRQLAVLVAIILVLLISTVLLIKSRSDAWVEQGRLEHQVRLLEYQS